MIDPTLHAIQMWRRRIDALDHYICHGMMKAEIAADDLSARKVHLVSNL